MIIAFVIIVISHFRSHSGLLWVAEAAMPRLAGLLPSSVQWFHFDHHADVFPLIGVKRWGARVDGNVVCVALRRCAPKRFAERRNRRVIGRVIWAWLTKSQFGYKAVVNVVSHHFGMRIRRVESGGNMRNLYAAVPKASMRLAATAVLLVSAVPMFGSAIAADPAPVDPVLAERMAKEKEARKACKAEICKAFASPESGAPISCDVTKTWTKDEILGKIVGGSYVWGYGNLQCTVKITLDRNAFSKVASDPSVTVALAQHKLICNVDDKDSAKGTAFKMDVGIAPKITFDKGKAKGVDFGSVTTEGSTLASAAVTSLLAADKISGVVSRAAAAEVNDFFSVKCKE